MSRYMIDVDADGQPIMVYDVVDKELVTICLTYYGAKDVCDLLNKQEDKIKMLEEEIRNANKRIIEAPPTCTWCEHFVYNEEADEKYICKPNCLHSNDIFVLWEDCPYLEKKYFVVESNNEREDDE